MFLNHIFRFCPPIPLWSYDIFFFTFLKMYNHKSFQNYMNPTLKHLYFVVEILYVIDHVALHHIVIQSRSLTFIYLLPHLLETRLVNFKWPTFTKPKVKLKSYWRGQT